MKNINWNSLLSWANVIATLATIALLAVLVCRSFKYIRAFLKRLCLVAKLRHICRKNGWKYEKLSSCLGSILHPTDGPEILITTQKNKYEIKFFTCLRYRDTYTLEGIGHYTTKSNANMILLGDRPYPYGVNTKSVDGEMLLPRMLRLGDDTLSEVTVEGENGSPEKVDDAVKILCVNPISIEMRRVAKSTTEQVFDGDELDGYTVYSGDKLCRAIV